MNHTNPFAYLHRQPGESGIDYFVRLANDWRSIALLIVAGCAMLLYGLKVGEHL